MKRLLVVAPVDPQLWADMFRAELPSFEVLDALPPIGSLPVPYIVVGRPPPGLIASVAGLELVLSLNAGIEHLLASGEVPPHLPIVRLVDPGLTRGMAEWVLAQVLSWHRNLPAYAAAQLGQQWQPLAEKLAPERRVAVLGVGALGTPVAEHLVRFGFQTRVWSRSGRKVAGAQAFAGPSGLAAAVAGADALVNLLPLTADTEGLLNQAMFERLAPGALVVNAARGGHVVDADLIAALDGGQLGWAALDVFRAEPLPPEHPFWRHPKVAVSPHVAAPTHARTAIAAMAESIRRHQRGEPVPHIVDRARGY